MATASKKTTSDVKLAEPLVLIGEPGALCGTLSLENAGAERKALRDLKLTQVPAKGGRGTKAKVSEPALAVDLPRVKIRAGTRKAVPLTVALKPSTPPGIYTMSFPLDGADHQAQVIVTEVVDFEVSPPEVFVVGKKGAKVEKLMAFQNHGNVPVTIPAIGAVQLDLDEIHCRAQRATLKKLEDTERTLDDVMRAMSLSYEAELASFAPLKVTNEAITLEAGQAASQIWTFQIPSKIPVRVETTAFIRILSETVTARILAV
ncbi:hypothetical protein [uncultured Ruegeria sp.]|uniref:hypothetical protein n=1 Tax=uncultured Ruegeria sp. TaxID=259304 RepID=UPI002622E8D6|nr:hypothetical protein [uncultured Ruegeria sp.]